MVMFKESQNYATECQSHSRMGPLLELTRGIHSALEGGEEEPEREAVVGPDLPREVVVVAGSVAAVC